MQQGMSRTLDAFRANSHDIRRPVVIPDAPRAVSPRAAKDRKRWCGGKVGVEHRLEWVYGYRKCDNPKAILSELDSLDYSLRNPLHATRLVEHRECVECGKHMGYAAENYRRLTIKRARYWQIRLRAELALLTK
jgi:hypothetical protein